MSIRDFLSSFYDATKATEGRQSTIDGVLPAMDFLLERFEEGIRDFHNDEHMSACIDAGWKKLTEYYRKADRAPAYIAAIVLNPITKWSYFSNWEPEWRAKAKQSLKSFWENSYRSSTGLVHRDNRTHTVSSTKNSILS